MRMETGAGISKWGKPRAPKNISSFGGTRREAVVFLLGRCRTGVNRSRENDVVLATPAVFPGKEGTYYGSVDE